MKTKLLEAIRTKLAGHKTQAFPMLEVSVEEMPESQLYQLNQKEKMTMKKFLFCTTVAALLLASFHSGRLYQIGLSRSEILDSPTKSTIRIPSLRISIHAPRGMLLTYKEDLR